MIIDSHAHYNDEVFDGDRDEILGGLASRGVELVVNIGTDIESSRYSIDLTNKYDKVYAVVGFHPDYVDDVTEEDYLLMREMLKEEKVVGIGEIGLDYHYTKENKEAQIRCFERQLAIAKEMDMPFVIHSRDAAKDTLDIMKAHQNDGLSGILHCFSYSKEMAREYVKMGYYIGIGGVVTFKNAINIKEVVAEVPIDRIVVETDCPYLAPAPFRGKRNESMYLKYIVEEIARIKSLPAEEVVEKANQNAKDVYRIK